MTPESPIRVAIVDRFELDGIAISLGLRFGPDDTRIMRIREDGTTMMEPLDPPGAIQNPTIRLQHEFARALLDALLRYYQGASDTHTIRADYLHERERVDGLISTISQIAGRVGL